MVVERMDECLNCSNDIVSGLIEVVSVSLFRHFPDVKVDLDDVEKVIGALTVLRPNVVEIETLTGLLHMFRGNWDEAMHVLRSVCERVPAFPHARTLLAVCLSTKGDASWRRVAAEAAELATDPHTAALVTVMQAREDLQDAIKVQQSGGRFVIPPTFAALIAEQDGGASEAAGSEGGSVPDSASYLRL